MALSPGAERWYLQMQERGIQADVARYAAMIHACTNAADPARAETWMEQMRDAGIEANVVNFNPLIKASVKAGVVSRARDGNSGHTAGWRGFRHCHPRSRSCARPPWCRGLSREMISQLDPDVEAQPKAFCHNSVLHVWARAGDTRKIRPLAWHRSRCGCGHSIHLPWWGHRCAREVG